MKFITENLGWKLLSLFISLALWLTFVADEELVMPISAQIQLRRMPEGLEVSSPIPERVFIEVRASSRKLEDEALHRTPVIIDLSEVQEPGTRTFTITRSSVKLPQGVEFLRAIPSQLRLRFERRATREIPVRLYQPPPRGFRFEIIPPFVRIVGPESRVNSISNAETDPIRLDAKKGIQEVLVNVYVSDPMVRIEGDAMVLVRAIPLVQPENHPTGDHSSK